MIYLKNWKENFQVTVCSGCKFFKSIIQITRKRELRYCGQHYRYHIIRDIQPSFCRQYPPEKKYELNLLFCNANHHKVSMSVFSKLVPDFHLVVAGFRTRLYYVEGKPGTKNK